jgi:hypothetical protein
LARAVCLYLAAVLVYLFSLALTAVVCLGGYVYRHYGKVFLTLLCSWLLAVNFFSGSSTHKFHLDLTVNVNGHYSKKTQSDHNLRQEENFEFNFIKHQPLATMESTEDKELADYSDKIKMLRQIGQLCNTHEARNEPFCIRFNDIKSPGSGTTESTEDPVGKISPEVKDRDSGKGDTKSGYTALLGGAISSTLSLALRFIRYLGGGLERV